MAQPADNRSLQELAVDVLDDIHKLATALAHAGAPPHITQLLEQSSTLFSGISKGLAAGPMGQTPVGDSQGAGPGPSPQPVGVPEGAQAPPAPPPGAPVGNTINGSSPTGPAHGDLHNAIVDMHKASVNAIGKAGR